jgi:hypothetical protein
MDELLTVRSKEPASGLVHVLEFFCYLNFSGLNCLLQAQISKTYLLQGVHTQRGRERAKDSKGNVVRLN